MSNIMCTLLHLWFHRCLVRVVCVVLKLIIMSFSVENERGNNFSAREVEILRNLIEKYGKTILCKKTDALGSQAKEKAWLHVTSEFNASTTTLRSVKQLKYKWEYMKRVARKEAGKQKQSIIKTGGGPPPPPMSDTSEWVSSIMKESIVGITSTYDGDSTPNNYVPLDADKVSIVQQLMGSEVNPGPSQDISYILAPRQELSEGAVDVDVTSNIESHIETPFRNIRKRFPKETPLKQSRLSVCTDVMKLKSEKIQLEINVMKETFDLEKKKRKLEEEREKLKFAAEMENIELEKKKKKIELLLLEKQLNI